MDALTQPELTAIFLSLKIGAASVVVSLPFGFALAYMLARKDFVLKPVVSGAIMLPLVLPPVVTGYVLLLGFGRSGVIGAALYDWFGITLAFKWTGAALAAAVMGLPLMVTSIRLSLESVDRRLETAARSLGAGPWRAFFTITLPLALPGVVAGAVLAFARSVGEFGATITFVSNIPGETQTLPIAIYTFLQSPGGDDNALRLSLFAIGLSLGAIITSEILNHRIRRD
ncbi:MAG: molybdate ABC transporter permease subunit [Rhodobacteraceae bacterium]|nr:molybdate ABC transporter permease subunit [Paracoccaceae bacterium]